MDKFTYGTYDPEAITDGPFIDSSYADPDSESETRKQFSFPLNEIKDFLNSTLPVDSNDKIIQFKLTDDKLIQYSLDGETWYDTASGGHQIYDEDNNQMPQKTRLMFRGSHVFNSGDYTVVEGVQGEQGVGVSSIVQTTESHVSGGTNIWTATLTNGNTYDFAVENGAKGDDGEKGEQGDGLTILGTYAALEDLQQAHPTGSKGDIYIVGTGDSNPAYVWDVDDTAWESIGKIRGEKGAKGDTGNTGATGTGIHSVVETTHSTASGGTNIWTVTLTNGATSTFSVLNGEAGAAGEGMPTGGNAGEYFRKKSSVDYDTEWASIHEMPNGGSSGQVLAKSSGTDYDTAWTSLPTVDQTYNSSSTNAQSGTAVAGAISTKQNSVLSGTTEPTSAQGVDGDIYILYTV